MRKNFVFSLFLCVIAFGYCAALINLYLSHAMADLSPGLTVNDVIAHYHGSSKVTRLTYMINSTMRQYLETDIEKNRLEEWVEAGASLEGYSETRSIFQSRCIRCHDMFGKAEFAPLTTLEEIHRYTRPATGVSWLHIAKLSHQHLFGMGFIFFTTGLVLFRSHRAQTLKTILLSIAYISVLLDIAGWSLTKLNSAFAFLVIGSGTVHAVCFAAIVLICLIEMWILKSNEI